MKRYWINEIKDKIGETVELYGWVNVRRDHGKIIFIDLRDRSGIAQLVFTPENRELYKIAETLRPEWVLSVKGEVAKRPKGMENPEIETGKVEIKVKEIFVFNQSETPPFPLDTSGYEIDEELRLKYRYLDLRRARLKNNLILRNKVIKFFRDYLNEKEFIEIETPILTKSTPEGARDYVVPSRLYPGKFYALPQSPQQYKQLLMVAGVEKYFQIARCFRDEDTRADRQPEFTQLDLEVNFIEKQEEILNLIEEPYLNLIKELFPQKNISNLESGKIPRYTYDEVMKSYGTDKPDLRKNKNDPEELAFAFITDFPMFEEKEDGSLGTIHHPFTLPKFKDVDDSYGYNHDRSESGIKLRKFLEEASKEELLDLRAYQYDFVCNGYEIGGGSIRTHDPNGVLWLVFKRLGHSKEDFKNKFGHLFDAFGFGVPPHAGIAMGLDRFIAILAGEPNIREVIAFPKTGDARDPMMSSPSELDKKQLKELHLNPVKSKKP